MNLQTALDRAVKAENENPQGLPADFLSGMEADIRANPEKYPLITAALAAKKGDNRA